VSPEPQPTSRLHTVYRIVLAVIAVSAGLIVVLSFAVDSRPLALLRGVLVEWTAIVVAFAILIGVVNVLRVHGMRIQNRQGTLYSVVLILAFLAVFVPGIMPAEAVPDYLGPYVGPQGTIVDFSVRYVQRPLQATFFSLLAFFAATAAWRAFRVRSMSSLIMLIACLLVLLGSIRLNAGEGWKLVVETRNWVMNVPVLAGARGILLGIALGTIVAGVRLLAGIERPYSD
jgi:hypothetical protein